MALTIDESRIVASPAWKRLQARLIEALRPFGREVLEAAGRALEEVEAA